MVNQDVEILLIPIQTQNPNPPIVTVPRHVKGLGMVNDHHLISLLWILRIAKIRLISFSVQQPRQQKTRPLREIHGAGCPAVKQSLKHVNHGSALGATSPHYHQFR